MEPWGEVAFVALGANLGDPRDTLERALSELGAWTGGQALLRSSLWRSAPLDCPAGSPDFVNAVAGLPCTEAGSPRELLRRLKEMEQRFGRIADGVRNGPRVLDLDIVTFGEVRLKEPDLVIPHPRAAQRRFVLCPLAEIAPGLRLPGHSRTVTELLASALPLDIEKL